jgi:hypothetical protein
MPQRKPHFQEYAMYDCRSQGALPPKSQLSPLEETVDAIVGLDLVQTELPML